MLEGVARLALTPVPNIGPRLTRKQELQVVLDHQKGARVRRLAVQAVEEVW